jgi:hypothetical protein
MLYLSCGLDIDWMCVSVCILGEEEGKGWEIGRQVGRMRCEWILRCKAAEERWMEEEVQMVGVVRDQRRF